MQQCLDLDIDGELKYGHWKTAFEMIREASGRCALRPLPAAESDFVDDDLSNFMVVGEGDEVEDEVDLDIDTLLAQRRGMMVNEEPP